jgi:PhoH-like ATPase
VVLPVVVIIELEAKRTTPSSATSPAGAAAARRPAHRARPPRRPACRSATEGGTLRVELNHTDPGCPPGFQLGDNDTRILAVARNLAAEGRDVTCS